MAAPDLPAELRTALERKAEGVSRGDAAQRAARISTTYRAGGNSGAIRTEADALAYALARMPATYAAVAASLEALRPGRAGWTPSSLLDVGAGPGTATWAVATEFSTLADFTLLDSSTALRGLALDLFRDSPRLSTVRYRHGEAHAALAEAAPADLVVASYLIGELGEAARDRLADLLWSKTRDVLLVVEPGTPAGYRRILDLRRRLIAQGAHVAAPCPHDAECPLAAPDWCHFAQRLPRLRAHMQVKGAELPFEDERFIYVALSRAPPDRPYARVLAPPVLSKVEAGAKLCTAAGVGVTRIPRRAKQAYAQARRWRWGDAVTGEHQSAFVPAGIAPGA